MDCCSERQLENLNDAGLLITWNALCNYNPSDVIYGVSMDTWAHMVKSEMERRGLPKKKYLKVSYRNCKYIAVLMLDQFNTVIRSTSNTLIPGLRDYSYYIGSDTDFNSWLNTFKQSNPDHEISILENPV